MLGSLLFNFEHILGGLLECGLLVFSVRTISSFQYTISTANFLLSTLMLTGISILFCDTYLVIGMEILYISTCSFLLLLGHATNIKRTYISWRLILIHILPMITLSILVYYTLPHHRIFVASHYHHLEIHEIILPLSILFIIVFSGILYLYNHKENPSRKKDLQ
jgi:hypothetical protein